MVIRDQGQSNRVLSLYDTYNSQIEETLRKQYHGIQSRNGTCQATQIEQ